MPGARILGTGSYVPPDVVNNDDLVARYGIDTDDAWILRRTGIRARRFAAEGVNTTALALHATQAALASCGLAATDLDAIVFCTLSPDHVFPGCGVTLQAALGLGDAGRFIPAIDVRNQCSGFLYGLSHAVALVRAGMAGRVLVVGAELQSAALDLTTRGRTVACLFGDGAGAVVVGACDDDHVAALQLGADGRFAETLSQRMWDMSARPFVPVDADGNGLIPPERLYAHMDGGVVFRHAVERMVETVRAVCAQAGVAVASVDRFFFHQANLRINQLVLQMLDVPEERAPSHIERYGNTTSASIPLLLDEAARSGDLQPGMTIVLVAFGSGFTWGGAVLRWGA